MHAPFAYLENEVRTACPPKLRLLLIEAALRLARQCRSCEAKPFPEETCRDLHGLQKILLHLLASIEHEDQALVGRIKSVYGYLYRTVAEARLAGDPEPLSHVVEVLQIERETWRTLTERYLSEVVASQQMQSTANSVSHVAAGFHCLA
jgi:flagellin-specific chaperone FliS